MTHKVLLKLVAGADDDRVGDATELKEDLDEDSLCSLFSFPVDQ